MGTRWERYISEDLSPGKDGLNRGREKVSAELLSLKEICDVSDNTCSQSFEIPELLARSVAFQQFQHSLDILA